MLNSSAPGKKTELQITILVTVSLPPSSPLLSLRCYPLLALMLSLVLIGVCVSMEGRVEMEETITLTQSSLTEGPAPTRNVLCFLSHENSEAAFLQVYHRTGSQRDPL